MSTPQAGRHGGTHLLTNSLRHVRRVSEVAQQSGPLSVAFGLRRCLKFSDLPPGWKGRLSNVDRPEVSSVGTKHVVEFAEKAIQPRPADDANLLQHGLRPTPPEEIGSDIAGKLPQILVSLYSLRFELGNEYVQCLRMLLGLAHQIQRLPAQQRKLCVDVSLKPKPRSISAQSSIEIPSPFAYARLRIF